MPTHDTVFLIRTSLYFFRCRAMRIFFSNGGAVGFLNSKARWLEQLENSGRIRLAFNTRFFYIGGQPSA